LAARSAASLACLSWLFSNSRSASSLPCVGERGFQIVDAVAEHFGFLDLEDQLAVEIGERAGSDSRRGCALRQFARRVLGFGALLGEPAIASP
jgi:hypothetical protein